MTNFVDAEYSLIDIKSRRIKKNRKIQKNKSTLIDNIRDKKEDKECETKLEKECSTQTCLQLLYDDVNNYNLNSLKSFLKKTEKLIEKELNENVEIDVWNDYCVSWEDNTTNSIGLKCSTHFAECLSPLFGGLCIDCNSSNNRIGVGFGLQSKHKSWCFHSNHIVIWNINNIASFEHCIEVSSCCTAIKYHPKCENIVSFGLFSGSIFVYELNNDGNSLLNRELGQNNEFHRELITDLCWIKTNHLISVSMDGKLFIWDFNYNSLSNPIMCYTLIPTVNYPFNTITNICFPQNEYDSNCFIICTQSGSIIKCLMNDDNIYDEKCSKKDGDLIFDLMAFKFYKNIKNKTNQIDVKRNIKKYLKLNKNIKIIKLKNIFLANLNEENINKLYSEINIKLLFNAKQMNNIQFSPFSPNIFLSSSINGSLQIFSLFSSSPIISIITNNAIFDAKWSPLKPCIIAVINKKQQLLIYDLFKNQYQPNNIIKIQNNNNEKIRLNKLCFNKSGNKIFINDNKANLYIVELSNTLIQHNPKEIKHLRKWMHLK